MGSLLMKCGHTDNAVGYWDGGEPKPVCAICSCQEVAEQPTRYPVTLRCSCGRTMTAHDDTELTQAAFAHLGLGTYYCGCKGWD
jgi:hypothetical protein